MKRTTLSYWIWRAGFEWRTRVTRKVARHFNRQSAYRGMSKST